MRQTEFGIVLLCFFFVLVHVFRGLLFILAQRVESIVKSSENSIGNIAEKNRGREREKWNKNEKIIQM